MTATSLTPNATFTTFKVTGKYYETGRGILPQDVFRPFYDPRMARAYILGANDGRMPGLRYDGADMMIFVKPDEDVTFGWPIMLKTATDCAHQLRLALTETVKTLEYARPLIERWCHSQGNATALFDEMLGPIDTVLAKTKPLALIPIEHTQKDKAA